MKDYKEDNALMVVVILFAFIVTSEWFQPLKDILT